LVFLANGSFWEGETFFISGQSGEGILTRFLPIVDTEPCFGAAARLAEAEIYLRLLGKATADSEVLLIGHVYSPQLSDTVKPPAKKFDPNEIYDLVLNRPAKFGSLAGASISITGSFGTTIVKADAKGIYEVSLTPDDYTLKPVDLPANLIAVERKLRKRDFARGGPFQLNFFLEWDGTIEGTVRDAAGNPAQVSLELQKPDGTELDRDRIRMQPSDKNPSFRFQYLPPGSRYIVMVNPFGPHTDSPYAPMYYPSAERAGDARVLEIRPNASHVNNVNFTVGRLPERKLQVRAIWPNGQGVQSASILVAYERTKYWDDLSRPSQSWTTDYKGVAEIQVFGDYRARVFAEKFIDDKKSGTPPWGSPRYSAVVELETAKLPQSLDLIVSSTKLAH
jgi:hypothetical protein